MGRLSSAIHAAVLTSAAAALFTVSACGDDDAAPDESAAGSGGAHVAGSSSSSGKSGSAGNVEAGMPGNTSSGGIGDGAAGESTITPGTGGVGNSSAGAPATGGANIGPPGPAPGGGSVYAVECSGETAMCGVEGSHCLGISLDKGGVGYACSNQCDTIVDCSDAPSGAAAEAGCVQFTKEKRCVLVCYNQPDEYACPDGMGCYIYPNSPIGYCLWMQ